MAIKHTAISYYGFNYVEHAEKDFQEERDRDFLLQEPYLKSLKFLFLTKQHQQ